MNDSQVSHVLRSPLSQSGIEEIWVAAAAATGWRIERASSAYASTDGSGKITIGLDEILDADDAVAQLIFHELCHGLVEGPTRSSAPDWGLNNADDRDVVREHACLRVQAHLAEPHGLRELMAPTTEYRGYHDAISGDPLVNDSDPAAALAADAVQRPQSAAWVQALQAALVQTRVVLDGVATRTSVPAPPGALHPVGFPLSDDARRSCGNCAWRYRGGRGRPVERCRQSAGADGNGRRTEARFHGCARWEPQVDCQTCGACCREAYHSVTVSVRDPMVWKQPHLVARNGHRFEVLRSGDRCAALKLQENPAAQIAATAPVTPSPVLSSSRAPLPNGAHAAPVHPRFSCDIYDDRPRTCRDFEAGGRHCLVARRRVGLTP